MSFDYHFETLEEQLTICVSSDHKFGTDAFLLSHFAGIRRKDIACDLGTGCGIIPLLWFRKPEDAPKKVYAVDIQEKAFAQLAITVEKNKLEQRLIPLHSDLKNLKDKLPTEVFGSFDVVTCNPPYKAADTGILSELSSEQIARHEVLCTIFDVCEAASKLLKFGGKLCICQRPERLCDVLEAMRKFDIEPKRIRFVQQRETSAPWLFLVEGKKGSKPFLQVEQPLIVEGKAGFSAELLKIYGKGEGNV